jgi:hypothetical protein
VTRRRTKKRDRQLHFGPERTGVLRALERDVAETWHGVGAAGYARGEQFEPPLRDNGRCFGVL